MGLLSSLFGSKKGPAPPGAAPRKKVRKADMAPGWSAEASPNAFYMRAFCASDRIPALAHALEWLASQEAPLKPENLGGASLNSTTWEHAQFTCLKTGQMITLQCNRDDGSPNCLTREEIMEFARRLKRPGVSGNTRKAAKHLEATKVVVACKLPGAHAGRETFRTNLQLLRYFATRAEGLIQIDGEGFYEDNRLLVDMHKARKYK